MAASFIRAAEDDLSCPVCFELFVDPHTPKILPSCGHVCCEVCLNKMTAGMCDKKCPECRRVVIIPKDGVASFLTNFRLRSLAENHRTVAAGISGGQTKTPNERREVADEKYGQQKVEMQSIIKKVSRDIKQAKDIKESLQAQAEKIRKSQASIEMQIDGCVEIQVNKVLEQSQILKNQVQQDSKKKMAYLQKKMVDIDREIESAETSHRDAAEALDKPAHEYVTQHKSLADQMYNLSVVSRVSQINSTTPLYAAARFEKAEIQNITLGRVVSDHKRKLKLIQTLDGFQSARNFGCSSDGSLLAVCDCDGRKVIIYRRLSNGQYEKSGMLNLTSKKKKPADVVIDSNGRYLVARFSYIEVYTPQGDYLKKITSGISGTGGGVCSVTIKSNGRILVGDVYKSVITEHDPYGNIERTIKTRTPPWFMSLIHDTHVAMSDSPSSKVSVMDLQSEQEILHIDIPYVMGICYDEQTDCLLTVRSEPSSKPQSVLPNTGVIEQYCRSTGRFVAGLAERLYHPHGINLLANNCLAVADKTMLKIYHFE